MANHSPVDEDLVDIINIGRARQREVFAGQCLHVHADSIPGISPILWVTEDGPPRDVSCLATQWIDSTNLGLQFHCLPLRIVKVRLRP